MSTDKISFKELFAEARKHPAYLEEVESEVKELEARIKELDDQLQHESIFRNELKLTAIGWQDEDDYCTCKHTEMCGDQLLEFIKEHESDEKLSLEPRYQAIGFIANERISQLEAGLRELRDKHVPPEAREVHEIITELLGD